MMDLNRKRAPRSRSLSFLALGCSILWSPVAAAQTQITAADDEADAGEIVVTASGRIADTDSAPIAVSTLSGELIAARLQDTLFDVAPQLPGLTLNGTAGYGNFPIGIRGIASSTSLIGADDPVAVYLDGVYLGKPSAIMGDLLEVAQIDVVRGPQGTLYGRNATAGAVLITRREPGRDPEFSASASYGSFERWRLTGRAAGPIGDGLGASLAVTRTDAEGWGRNIFDGSPVVKRRGTAGIGTLAYDRNGLRAVLRADYMDERINDGYKKLNAIPYVAARPNIADASLRGDESTFAFNFPTFLDHNSAGVSLNVETDFSGMKLQSVTAWRTDTVEGSIDTDGTAASVNTNVTDEHHEQFTQSLILSGVSGATSWIAGVDAYNGKTDLVQVVGLVPLASSLTISASANVTAVGAFTEITQKLGEAVAITAGARINHDHKDFESAGAGRGVFPTTPPRDLKHSWTSFTPALRVSYTPTNDFLIYASVAKGFKSGGMTALQATPFEPETVWSYEVGSKWESSDRKVRITGAVFHADYNDLQVRVSRSLGIIQTLNAASATVRGAEFEANLQPVQGLRFSAFVNYTDAEYEDYIGPGPFDNEGETLNRAPKWQVGATAGFEHPTQIGSFSAEAVYSYRSRIYFSAPNVNGLSSEAYNQIDLRGGYETPDGRWSLAIVGKNLTQNRRINNVIIFGGNLVGSFNEPRSVQVQVGVKF